MGKLQSTIGYEQISTETEICLQNSKLFVFSKSITETAKNFAGLEV